MCVIAYQPKDSKEITENRLLAMWLNNPDGAGIMYKDDKGNICFSKGYMDFYDFYRDYLIIKRDYNFECGIHFRVATSGGINKQMCHPFIITNSENKIKKTYGNSEICIMHNGIIPIYEREGLNDTCEYIITRLYPLYKNDKEFFENNKIVRRIESEINYGKLLIFAKDKTKMIGDWVLDDDIYYSNMYFRHLE